MRRKMPAGDGSPAGTFSSPGKIVASAKPAEAVIEIAEFHRARLVGNAARIIGYRLADQGEIFRREDGAGALGFGHGSSPFGTPLRREFYKIERSVVGMPTE
jgi:hypothetical protein